MKERNDRSRPQPEAHRTDAGGHGSPGVFGSLWALLFLMAFLVAGPWAGFHGVLLGALGLLVMLRPPKAGLPGAWWVLAITFAVAGSAAFLPAGWFSLPEWRRELESLGVETGTLVAIQSRHAAEALALFVLTLFAGLWMAGQRASSSQVRLWALAFTLGVAIYALIARNAQGSPHLAGTFGAQHFGFFPNRNHSATYLAMGAICGLGCVLQSLRDKRFVALALALVATAVCLWAIASWSISRAGVVLVAIGGLLWVSMLGRRYLGRHGLWAIALIALTAVGLFFTASTEVRERLTVTAEKAGSLIETNSPADPAGENPALDSSQRLDFRIPVFFDALGLIREFPWTGIGAGQFYYVFPQYRERTIVANDSDVFHPESDWLWMAAETGIPATLALLALVLLACRKSLKDIRSGRDRALRAGCLAAAMLLPFHGIFDVPGHRITLAWTAVFLFALSLHPPSAEAPPSVPSAWPSRLLAVCLLAASAFLVHAQWFGGSPPATTAAAAAIARAQQFHREDQALLQAAEAAGREHQPDPAEDKLEQALGTLEIAKTLSPLNRDLPRFEAYYALHFDDKYARVDRAFAIGRALDPALVAGPLRQAEAWAPIDAQRTARLWSQALLRARAIDRLDPANPRSSTHTQEIMRQMSKNFPELEPLLPQTEP